MTTVTMTNPTADAIQWTGSNLSDVNDFLGDRERVAVQGGDGSLYISIDAGYLVVPNEYWLVWASDSRAAILLGVPLILPIAALDPTTYSDYFG
jgi:hypothetical protein